MNVKNICAVAVFLFSLEVAAAEQKKAVECFDITKLKSSSHVAMLKAYLQEVELTDEFKAKWPIDKYLLMPTVLLDEVDDLKQYLLKKPVRVAFIPPHTVTILANGLYKTSTRDYRVDGKSAVQGIWAFFQDDIFTESPYNSFPHFDIPLCDANGVSLFSIPKGQKQEAKEALADFLRGSSEVLCEK